MNDDEKSVMQQHMQYWANLTDQRNAIVYGPVFDPAGVFGMAVIEVDTDDEARNISEQDPAVSSTICTCQLLPMQVGLLRK
jgi:uncharacterized protein YciI